MFTSMLAILGIQSFVSFGSIGIQANICHADASTSTPTLSQPIDGAVYSTASPISLSGTAAAGATVTLTDNSQTIAAVTANEVGGFSLQLYFAAGSHTIGISAADACATSTGASVSFDAQTPAVVTPPTNPVVTTPTVPTTPGSSNSSGSDTTDTTTPPDTSNTGSGGSTTTGNLTLSLTSPVNDSTTNADVVAVTGSVSRASKITVTDNGVVVATITLQQTKFSFAVPISEGANAFTVTADDGIDTASVATSVTRATPSNSTSNLPWYKTRPGKAVIIGTSSAAVIIIIVILIILL